MGGIHINCSKSSNNCESDIDSVLYQCKQYKKTINNKRKVNVCRNGHMSQE